METSSIFRKNILWLISVFSLAACQNIPETGSAIDEADQDIIKREVVLSPELQELLYRLPTPADIAGIIHATGAPYIFSLTNPPENLSRSFTQKTKALNLGIYSIDLAYSSVYHRKPETDQFIYCTGKLAEDLGIGSVYDKTLMNKVSRYMNNRDSLVGAINGLFIKTSDFLRRNNRNQIAVLVASGAFVEGIYITASLCQVTRDNELIASVLLGQKESLEKLWKILADYGTDVSVRPVADEMAKLRPIFTDYWKGKSIPKDKIKAILQIVEPVRMNMIR